MAFIKHLKVARTTKHFSFFQCLGLWSRCCYFWCQPSPRLVIFAVFNLCLLTPQLFTSLESHEPLTIRKQRWRLSVDSKLYSSPSAPLPIYRLIYFNYPFALPRARLSLKMKICCPRVLLVHLNAIYRKKCFLDIWTLGDFRIKARLKMAESINHIHLSLDL